MSSVEEFRRHGRKTITLPSGLTVVIHPCNHWDWFSKLELPVPSAAAETTVPAGESPLSRQEQFEQAIMRSDLAILAGCLDPPFQRRGAPDHPEFVNLDDLTQADYEALAQAIFVHSGLVTEVAQQVEAFRDDGQRAVGEGDGGALPRPAASDSPDDARRILPQSADYDLAGRGDGSSLTALVGSTTGERAG